MHPILVSLIIIISALILFFGIVYFCYFLVFKTTKKQKRYDEFNVPKGKIYIPHREQMIAWQKEARKIPHEDVEIKSYDGLTLRGRFYEYEKGAPIEIMFHGYRGNSERDLAGGVQRCFSLKRSTIIVDQRGQAKSDGNLITFGVREKLDALSWANYAYERFGDSVSLLLTGISMGASTVMLASELELPPTVKGIIADCGYSSAKKIIIKVIKKLYLPAFLFYPIIKLSAKIFGKFNLDDADCEKALANAKVPVMFIHGKTDEFVPSYMSEDNFKACKTEKSILLVDGAGHGLAYVIGATEYFNAIREFDKKINL
ncbi:MAG: alpha/beta hydrolase [Clostridia bacterium]|nr:alpha/beta hydrolase [Clostridia bacterium]